MKLEDLTGLHKLSGIDTGTLTRDGYWGEETCNYIKFTLDGVHYLAVEDPDDGYRSRCEELVVSEEPPKFTFPPQEMVCSMMPNDGGWGYSNDVLILTDKITGEVVLEVGTMDYDDYYPCCHFHYAPENMACNAMIEISEDEFNKILQ